MTNDFYRLLLSEKWVWKKNDETSEGKLVKWVGPAQYEDANTHTLVMLPTDYSLVKDGSFKKWVDVYAKDNDKFFEDFSKVVAKLFELGVPFKGTPVGCCVDNRRRQALLPQEDGERRGVSASIYRLVSFCSAN
jgi:catalase (peroxidase I)